jgi:hypothetical protein
MKKLTLSLLIIAIAFTACKKDKKESQTVNIPLIKSEIRSYPETSDRDSMIYSYDTQNRLISYKQNGGKYTTAEYGASTVIFKSYNGKGVLQKTETYNLNAQGWYSDYSSIQATTVNSSIKSKRTFKSQLISQTDFNEKYFYDNQGHLIKSVSIDGNSSDTTFNYFTNDNVILRVTKSWANNTLQLDSAKYEYYLDKLTTIEMNNIGIPNYGKPLTNLIKKITYSNEIDEFTYDFDDQNRVIKETALNNGKLDYYIDYVYIEK